MHYSALIMIYALSCLSTYISSEFVYDLNCFGILAILGGGGAVKFVITFPPCITCLNAGGAQVHLFVLQKIPVMALYGAVSLVKLFLVNHLYKFKNLEKEKIH